MKNIKDINFKGIRALIRVDFNVPLDKQFNITDDSRIRLAIPTIKKIIDDGGSVVLMSHLGRPLKKLKEDGSIDFGKFTLRHLVERINQLIGTTVQFTDNCIGDEAIKASSSLKAGNVLLLENLRFHKEEEKGDESFAKALSLHGDYYVNDAFGTAHRAHASTAIIAKFFPGKKCMGLLMASELENADLVMHKAQKPFTAVMGGAKVSDKILIIENLLTRADNIIIGGGMAYTFFKAQGGSIGNSLVEEDRLDLALQLIDKAKKAGCNLFLPVDSVIADKFDKDANTNISDNMNIPDAWMGLDIGPVATKEFVSVIKNSKTILWNGPMGVFEMKKFESGTRIMAEAIAEATSHGAYSLIGGGDSAAAVTQFGYADKVSYVSTGGGALLEYFEGKELPGVIAINE
ncbi:MAG: phosphoglycerate kinase [Bacteroidetes bacterium]|nr:MAG: phosphoglycerate kinase [Bacteroidota bacterium]